MGALLVKSVVSIHFGNGSGVVEALNLFDKCVVTSIMRGEEGEEPESCGLCGGLSIVRMEKEFNDVCGFPRLLPCQ